MTYIKPKLPVFSDYVRNVDPRDADDVRFFVSNMCVPVEVPRDFAADQIKAISRNRAVHPHLRWRCSYSLNIAKVFGSTDRKVASVYIKSRQTDNYVRTIHYNPFEYMDISPVILAVDHIIADLCGHIIFPKNPNTLGAALKIFDENRKTNEKFTRFRDLVVNALEDNYQCKISTIISILETEGARLGRFRKVQRPANKFHNVPNKKSNVVSL